MSSKKKSSIQLSKLLSYAGCARAPLTEDDFKDKEGFSRRVFCNEPDRHSTAPFNYTLNYISTTKYSILTFIPKALYEQFRRAANLYFLMNAIVGLTPISPYQPYSLILPLVFVVGLSMFKEALEDWRRWNADQEVNSRPVLAHNGDGEFQNKEWKKIRVGDIVKVEKDNFFPADLLLLSSSYPDGICYVETMNLDGETNLKLRKASERTLELNSESAFQNFQAHIECEDPNPNLYTFIGNFDWNGEATSISPQQILLRDSKLRNTSHVYGIVIFTGHDTKVMQNSLPSPSKRSRIEKRMDKIIYLLFIILIVICTVGSIIFGVRTKNQMPDWWYLRPDDVSIYYDPSRAAVAAILQALTQLTLYTYLIPISLYVSIEIVKVLQAIFISNDLKMYYEENDTPARARTSNLNEELGQVDTILSDKTGTLTCNQMEFLKCSVAGIAFGRGVTEVEKASAKRLGRLLSELDDSIGDNPENYDGEEKSMKEKEKGFAFKDDRLMNGRWIHERDPETIRMFMRIMSVCHTAIPEEDEITGKITYEAESPDEASFVVAAKKFGFEFFKRTQSSVFVRESDPMNPSVLIEREYKILNLIEFNSTRKRMSVIVEDEDGRIIIMCKGADSVIFERLSPNGMQYIDDTKAHLKKYGEAGLRTLALSYAILDRGNYEKWNQDYQNAKSVLATNREALLDNCAENIENNLILVGATAVEDKLQQGVPETIDHLAQAGLKIWVLTGDKLETAINIGFACSLLRQDMEQIVVSLDTPEYNMIEATGDKERLKEYCYSKVQEQILEGAKLVEKDKDEDTVFAFIIDGKSLIYALDDSLKTIMLGLAMQCASVICCRVSPKQKALITRLVKDGTGKVTLGIGDGANDVGMIQEADIGIGISGVEGQQAVMASDFSIAQFKFLDRLLTVHGHWCYKRIASMITYFFFKNLAFGFTLFFFNAYTVFSGQVIYNDWHASLFNVFFTSLPVIALGVLEQDVSADTCQKFPILYQQGPLNLFFSWGRILSWMINGIYISIVSFWLIIYIFDMQSFENSGRLPELAGFGVTLYTCIIWSVNLQLALTIDHYTWITHLFIWGSIALWYIFVVIYGYMSPTYTTTGYKIFTEVMAPSPIFWICTLLLPVVSLLPILVYKSMQWRFVPMDHQIIQEMKYLKKDVADPTAMAEEARRAVLKSQVGFTAAVNAVVKRMVKKGKLPKAAKKSANDLARMVDTSAAANGSS